METFVELDTVEETKHLVPNLPILAKALFGEDSILVDWRRSHGDWATSRLKFGDGLLWLPWASQLWLIEVEWTEGSNFFDQARAFARGKVDTDHLFRELRQCLHSKEAMLDTPTLKTGHVVNNIVQQTFERHVKDGSFTPHGWVILGHTGNNIAKLRKDYEEELAARFKGSKHYILSMARMFHGTLGAYILLEQHCSHGCTELLAVRRSILVPATPVSERPTAEPEKLPTPHSVSTETAPRGQAARLWQYLKTLNPNLLQEQVRLRIQIDDKHFHDFRVDWNHAGKELLVFEGTSYIHQKPANAAKTVFGDLLRPIKNIALSLGTLINLTPTGPELIARYRDIYSPRQPARQPLADADDADHAEGETYFDELDAYKQRRIQENILDRRTLWEEFLAKRRLTPADFKRLSDFKPKAITGFMAFLTHNKIVRRKFNVFILSDAVVPKIQAILAKNSQSRRR